MMKHRLVFISAFLVIALFLSCPLGQSVRAQDGNGASAVDMGERFYGTWDLSDRGDIVKNWIILDVSGFPCGNCLDVSGKAYKKDAIVEADYWDKEIQITERDSKDNKLTEFTGYL